MNHIITLSRKELELELLNIYFYNFEKRLSLNFDNNYGKFVTLESILASGKSLESFLPLKYFIPEYSKIQLQYSKIKEKIEELLSSLKFETFIQYKEYSIIIKFRT